MIPWLDEDAPFPPVEQALAHPNGLLCAGERLSARRLMAAYRLGIFPWYNAGEPVLWWSPDPRMVLFCNEFRVHRTLRRTLRRVAAGSGWQVRLDTAVDAVIRACADPSQRPDGTWITEAVIDAYTELHRHQFAHSIEVWDGSALVGGLYGVSIGRMFYGESMFTRATDASKTALAALVALLRREHVKLIDCQQRTSHLASLGGRAIPRAAFQAHVAAAVAQPPIDWLAYAHAPLNSFLLPTD
ncbi:MAG: leucyl/phenylalanyl-tRNA--protein transferase [Betaproteobacteria bacterium]